ncbi:exocyst complex component 3-like protein 2 isoform X2 [Ascaphus truei]|uniref:exocyst complex component 3-like protein 2 isoform X2 n=1 Tax=Ascaphus truei TaxID=8439 RepID=UPI003F598263
MYSGTSRTTTMPSRAPNPFDEEEEETPSARPSPEGGNPFHEEGGGEPLGPDVRRRGTLEKITGLSPFWRGRMLLGRATPEKRWGRRRSEDASLLRVRRKDGGGGGEEEGGGVKRLSFLWLGGGGGGRPHRESIVDKLLEGNEGGRVGEKIREPLSVLEILHLIQHRELRSADQHITELEEECEGEAGPEGTPRSPGRQAKDVALLYEALMKEMWAVVEESLNVKGAHPPLDEVIGVIQQEEARVGPPGAWGMRGRWAEAVGKSVNQRLRGNLEGKMGSLASQAERVKRSAVEDLTAVKNYLVCSYPKDFEVFRVYLSAYHHGIAEWLSTIAQRTLETNEIYFILDWNSNVYCRDVLSRPEISPLINPAELGPLLHSDTQKMLEQHCLRVSQRLEEELKTEQERWKQDSKNEDIHSAFSGRVIQIMRPHLDRTPGISERFGVTMSRSCLTCFTEFLHSFKKVVERFHAEHDGVTAASESYIYRVTGIVNCCPPFREFAARLAQLDPAQGAEPLHQAEGSLDRITSLGTRGICDLMLRDLKPCTRKLLGRRWLSSSEACDGMVTALAECVPALRKMSSGPYQAVVSELHRRVLLELVRPLIQGRMVCTTSKTRRKVAAKLREEAKQLGQIFSKLDSPNPSLDLVVPRIAEILVLEDTPSIQMEVGMLVTDFPDFRKRHLSAILDVRGLWDQGPRQEILGVLHDMEGADMPFISRAQGFFSDVPVTRDTRCLHVSISRATQLGRWTLSRLRCLGGGGGIQSQLGVGLGSQEEDSQL